MKRIWTIWEKGDGVLLLHMFNCIASGEAFCREAAMIDAIGKRERERGEEKAGRWVT